MKKWQNSLNGYQDNIKKQRNKMQDQKTLDFLQKLKDSGHWNDNYDYSKVDFIDRNKLVIVIDKFGFEHELVPRGLMDGGEMMRR